jgi:hypothetical protein
MKAIACFSLVATILMGVASCQKPGEGTTPNKAQTPETNGATQDTKGSEPKHTGEGRVYKKTNGFSIIPPKGWVTVDAPGSNAFLFYTGPNVDGLSPNFNVRSVPDDGTPVEKMGASVKAGYASKFKQWKLADEGFMTIDGKKAYFISFQCPQRVGDREMLIQTRQYAMRGNNKKLYILTFTTVPKRFDELKKSFDEAAQTVQTD